MAGPTFQITFDANDPDRLADFWSRALGYKLQDPPEGFSSWEDWMKANNLEHLAGTASALVDPEGKRPRLYFQKVPEGKTAKNRVHIDINVVQSRDVAVEERARILDQEAGRLAAMGARRGEVIEQNGEYWVVMSDPEGNEFCIQ